MNFVLFRVFVYSWIVRMHRQKANHELHEITSGVLGAALNTQLLSVSFHSNPHNIGHRGVRFAPSWWSARDDYENQIVANAVLRIIWRSNILAVTGSECAKPTANYQRHRVFHEHRPLRWLTNPFLQVDSQ